METLGEVAVIGGAGRVGLPLALLFADHGLKTNILDLAPRKLEQINAGEMPFAEDGAPEVPQYLRWYAYACTRHFRPSRPA